MSLIQKRSALSVKSLPYKVPQAGFSLPEVLIVIAIIGVLAAIAIPSFLHWLPNIRLKAAARDLYANMQETKIQAIKQNKDWAVVFDTVNNRYYICSDQGVDDDWTTLADNTVAKSVSLHNYKSGVTYGSGNCTSPPASNVTYVDNTVLFNPRGTIDPASCATADCYVYLDHQKNTDTVRVGTFSSGVVKISRWTGSVWK